MRTSLSSYGRRLLTTVLFTVVAAQGALADSAARSLSEVRELKVMTYNIDNFFLGLGKFKGLSDAEFKKQTDSEKVTPQRMTEIAKAISETNPDFIVVEEVECLETIEKFSADFLGNRYKGFLVEGNDERGINIGYLVKRDLPLLLTLESHKDATWKDPADHKTEPVFSRDAPALLVRRQNAAPDSAPLFIFIGNHAKSQRNRPNDPGSHVLRLAQFEEIGLIIDDYQRTYGKDVPIMVGGDFNVDVRMAEEMKPLNERLMDPFDAFGIKGLARMTHTFHQRDGHTEFHQLDAVLVTPSLKNSLVNIETYRYKDADGNVKPLPKTYDERSRNPSDHFPLVLTLSTELFFPEAFAAPLKRAAGF